MTGRTVREILTDRERELNSELKSLVDYQSSLETELQDVRRAIAALLPKQSVSDRASFSDSAKAIVIPADERKQALYAQMTINELVLDALDTHFAEGASHATLREAFGDKYERKIEQSSLRSQLARLKAMGLIKETTERGVVKLTPRGAAQAQNERRQRMLRLQSRL